MIRYCPNCDHESEGAQFQDATYGFGNRVYNPQGAKQAGKARCTICGISVAIGNVEVKKETKEKK